MAINETESRRKVARRTILELGITLTAGAIAAQAFEQKPALKTPPLFSSWYRIDREINFGIRNDVTALMPLAKKLGAGHVRIEGQDWDIRTNPRLRNNLETASRLDLPVLYIFNPVQAIQPQRIQELLSPIVHIYSTEIEIGNEVDNLGVPFWEQLYQSYHSSGDEELNFVGFAKHARTTILIIKELDQIRRAKKPTRIILGALANVKYAQAYKESLQSAGINLDGPNLFWAVHAYHSVCDVEEKIEALLKVRYPASRLRFTEIGLQGKDKSKLSEMMRRSFQLTGNPITVHELPNMNPEYEPDMGLADLEGTTYGFDQIAEFIQRGGIYK